MPHIVYFISSHGFGHAARAAAIITALGRFLPESRFTLFTTVPEWFFQDSLEFDGPAQGRVAFEAVDTDLGLVQKDALTEDLPATVRELRRRIPFPDKQVDDLARRVDQISGDIVLCDIAPLGLAVARRCGRPSVLIENFTWDWIYRGYLDECPQLEPLAEYLGEVFASADHHVQTEPACVPDTHALQVAPVSRSRRLQRSEVRRQLGVPPDARMAMITMGGVDWSYDSLATELSGDEDPWLVIPGSKQYEQYGRVIRLPHRSDFFHPDLIHAADVVIGKLGYSTLAEVWSSGVPLGYLTRPRFGESPKLEAWVKQQLPHRRLDAADLKSSAWLDLVRELLEKPRRPPKRQGGAAAVARFIGAIVDPAMEKR